ncbi:MAG: helix-turn-helix transcriptional regulator, partial [Bdellovibrionales bacterium]|nr:helix-turn-helix transcriptional regulator [Oligoflexia bacterium]
MENINKKSLAKSPNWVGAFIRQKREEKGFSQKELGQKFEPPVTTQFVSNLERGI